MASVYSDHANKQQIDANDVRLAIKSFAKRTNNPALEREVILLLKFSAYFIVPARTCYPKECPALASDQ